METGNVILSTVMVNEDVYRDLPIAVRVLIAAYARPIPSGNTGVYAFEATADEWSEIHLQLKRFEHPADPDSKAFVATTTYQNDYYCDFDVAEWSVLNCSSSDSDECPICSRVVEAVRSEPYVMIRYAAADAAIGLPGEPVSGVILPTESASENGIAGEAGGES